MKVLSKGRKKIAAGFLLYGYVIFFLAFTAQNIHRATHYDTHCGLSDNECDGDACHLALVHHDLNRGCHHPSHLTAPEKFCSCSDLHQAVFPCIPVMMAVPADHVFFNEYQPGAEEHHPFCRIETGNRGPPASAQGHFSG